MLSSVSGEEYPDGRELIKNRTLGDIVRPTIEIRSNHPSLKQNSRHSSGFPLRVKTHGYSGLTISCGLKLVPVVSNGVLVPQAHASHQILETRVSMQGIVRRSNV